MIKIEHTVFALPFAFLGALLAVRSLPRVGHYFLLLLYQEIYLVVRHIPWHRSGMCAYRCLDSGPRLPGSKAFASGIGCIGLDGWFRHNLCLPGYGVRPRGVSSFHPPRFGIAFSLWSSAILHLLMIALLAFLFVREGLGTISLVGLGIVAAFLAHEHSPVKLSDLSNIKTAFFLLTAGSAYYCWSQQVLTYSGKRYSSHAVTNR